MLQDPPDTRCFINNEGRLTLLAEIETFEIREGVLWIGEEDHVLFPHPNDALLCVIMPLV